MATVVLTAVGSLFGPVGAAIGAIAGQAIDGAIFKPAGRQGPRVADLRVQTSSFGTQIPQIFGRMRVAGTVIWATDLMENVETSGGGKGRPSVTSYSYSASFAVALSSRPIAGIGRIWADGNLLRGAVGDFKAAVGAFRVHEGGADMAVDPLIAADRGPALAPAHRGMAYVVFEGLNLADFGNRVPSLTFEIFADAGGVPVTAIAAALAGGETVAFAGVADGPMLGGYAASGDSAKEALQPLLDGYGLMLRPEGETMALVDVVPVDRLLRVEGDLAVARGETLPGRTVEGRPVDSLPRRLSVRHYDPARDYQAGIQSAERPGAGREEAQIDLPATLDAGDARQRAEEVLRRRVLGRRSMTVARGWDALTLAPGDVVAVEGQGGGWRLDALEWEGMAVTVGLSAVPTRPVVTPAASDGGVPVRQADRIVSPTHVSIVETPQLQDSPVDAPQLFVAASGENGGWRGATILLRDETEGYRTVGSIRRGAVMGTALSVLGEGTSRLFDDRSTVEVELWDGDAILVPASDAALLNGANACLIGEELLQFGTVSPMGARRYRLGRLLRGRRGTEQWMQGHEVGDGFLLLDAERLLPLEGAQASVGRRCAVAAQGLGDMTPAVAECIADGRALVPPSPVHVRIAGNGATGMTVGWTRRSRMGWAWSDGVDAPVGEEQEAYLVEIWAEEVRLRSDMVSTPGWFYAPDAIADDMALAPSITLTLSVRQRGTHGPGAAAHADLSL